MKTKRYFGKRGLGAALAMALSTATVVAQAEDDEATSEDAAGDESEASEEDAGDDAESAEGSASADEGGAGAGATSTGTTSETGGDGGRFRFGIAAGAGPLSADGIDMTYYGTDVRLGWQVSNALGVYAQPQLGYYKLDGVSAMFGSGGLIGFSVVADYTLFDRLFVGAGLGYAILNNPSGSEVHLRAGGYPLVSLSDEKVRRKALMLGIDFRMHFVESYTFIAPTFNIGYESF